MREEFNTLIERLSEITDEQLNEFEEVLVGELETAAEERNVEVARELKDAIASVRTEAARRSEEAAAREAELAEILAEVFESNPDDDAEGDDAEADEAEDADAADDADASTEDAPSDIPADEPAPTASTPTRPLPSIAEMKNRQAKRRSASRPASTVTAPDVPSEARVSVIALSDGGGVAAGTELPDRASRARLLVERYRTFQVSSGSQRLSVIRQEVQFPEERLLRTDDPAGNMEKIHAVTNPASLVASGGICAPLTGYYDAMTLAVAERPIKSSLPSFGADRGGIRFIPPSTISDVNGAITHITEAEDASGTDKNCLTITCGDITEATINAISRCLQFGNFNARTHPEYVAHIQDLTLGAWARVAESNLWESMCDASTAVTAAENLSAWRDLYASVGRAVAAFRSRHRMSPRSPFRFMAPFWLADMLTIDLARQMPGDQTQAVAVSTFEGWLRNLGVNVTWTLEGGTDAPTQVFGTQGVGALDGWPDTVETLLFPEGSFLYLDGGTLDLGIVRDSTLNLSNDFQIFAEGFETVAFMGVESYCLTLDLCPSGLSAGQDDSPLNCAVGVSS